MNYNVITFLCFAILFKLPFTQQNRRCDLPLVPGLEQMTRGIDITRMDFLPVHPAQDLGYRRDLYEFSCYNGGTWQDQELYPDETFSLPDQVQFMLPNPAPYCSKYIEITEIDSIQGYKHILENHYGVCGLECPEGSYALSASYMQLQKMLIQTNSTQLSVYFPKGCKKMTSAMLWQFGYNYIDMYLKEDFSNDISNLPPEYVNNSAPYEALLSRYGTHFFTDIIFSRFVYVQAFVEKKLFDSSHPSIYYDYMEDVFRKECGQNVNLNKWLNDSSVASFHKSAIWETLFLGGKDGIQKGPLDSTETYESWIKSSYNTPWLSDGWLEPISKLVKDLNIRKQVQIAIEAKIAKAYLQSLKYALQLLEQSQNAANYLLLGVFSPARVIALIDKISDQSIPDKDAISRIKGRV